jgi:hypothetical protein
MRTLFSFINYIYNSWVLQGLVCKPIIHSMNKIKAT